MRLMILVLPVAAAVSSAAAAQISKEHRKAFSLVADAITSGQTCNEIGYQVDFEGVVGFRGKVEDAAVADGHNPAEVRKEIDERIRLRYRMLKRRFNRDELNARSDSQRGQHHRYWTKQCNKLADNDLTADLFSKPA